VYPRTSGNRREPITRGDLPRVWVQLRRSAKTPAGGSRAGTQLHAAAACSIIERPGHDGCRAFFDENGGSE